MNLISEWLDTEGTYGWRPYKDNTHVSTIWWDVSHPSNDFDYWDGRNGTTDDWHEGAQRDSLSRKQLWPLLDPPTNLNFTSVTSTSITFTWSGNFGDGNRWRIWRSTDTLNWGSYSTSTSNSFTDFAVSSGNRYWYCVRAEHQPNPGPLGPPGPQAGPCSAWIDALVP
jgi:hypothetical protein